MAKKLTEETVNNPREIGQGDIVRVKNEFAAWGKDAPRYKILGNIGNQLKMTSLELDGQPEKMAYAFELARVPVRKGA